MKNTTIITINISPVIVNYENLIIRWINKTKNYNKQKLKNKHYVDKKIEVCTLVK